MSEEDKTNEPAEDPKQDPSGESTQSYEGININTEAAANDMIVKANEAAERLEGANRELSKLLTKQEQLKVEATFGGTAEAGKQENTEEQKAIAAAKKLVEGTGFEDDLFPEKKEKV